MGDPRPKRWDLQREIRAALQDHRAIQSEVGLPTTLSIRVDASTEWFHGVETVAIAAVYPTPLVSEFVLSGDGGMPMRFRVDRAMVQRVLAFEEGSALNFPVYVAGPRPPLTGIRVTILYGDFDRQMGGWHVIQDTGGRRHILDWSTPARDPAQPPSFAAVVGQFLRDYEDLPVVLKLAPGHSHDSIPAVDVMAALRALLEVGWTTIDLTGQAL